MSVDTQRSGRINLTRINSIALSSAKAVTRGLLPDGQREGHKWVARNPNQPDRRLGNFKVNLSSGTQAEFVTGDSGGDFVVLAVFVASLARLEAESQEHRLYDWRKMPGRRSAAACRVMQGQITSEMSSRADAPTQELEGFQSGKINPLYWRSASRMPYEPLENQRAGWCYPERRNGANCIFLDEVRRRSASDLDAIATARALIGHRAKRPSQRISINILAQHVVRLRRLFPSKVKAQLLWQTKLSAEVRSACFRQLGNGQGGAGAYFVPSKSGHGWREIGCNPEGCCG